MSYTVNGTIPTSSSLPNNLAINFANQYSTIITLAFTTDTLNQGTHLISLKATSVIPSDYSLPMTDSNSVSQNFQMYSCADLAGPDIFVYPTDLPVGSHDILIGSQTTQISFSNFTDTKSQSINTINACGKISFNLWLNDVQVTTTSSPISFTQATSASPSNVISLYTIDRSISPTSQVVSIQAYLEGTSFTSGFRNFTVNFVDQCLQTIITAT